MHKLLIQTNVAGGSSNREFLGTAREPKRLLSLFVLLLLIMISLLLLIVTIIFI